MKRILACSLLLLCAACDDDGDDRWSPYRDSGADSVPDHKKGVCKLSDCPVPDTGLACCTPDAECGFDPSGLGFACMVNTETSDRECVVDDCPVPTVGTACCTPFALCGFDPFESGGQFCFGYPPPIDTDSGVPLCIPDECPDFPATSGYGCCLPNGECGIDPWGNNACFPPPPPPPDAGAPPPVYLTPPDDPSVDGQCPSYLGLVGPVWGCCSSYGVCGTYAYDACLLPVGARLPVGDEDADAGGVPGSCTPPSR